MSRKTTREILADARRLSSHWGRRIIAAAKRGRFTEADKTRAGLWITCACGKADGRLPRHASGTPLDDSLYDLGFEFMWHVGASHYREAALTLVAIEKRAAEIIAEMQL